MAPLRQRYALPPLPGGEDFENTTHQRGGLANLSGVLHHIDTRMGGAGMTR